MNQAEAEAHLPDQVLPEVDGPILPNYDLVDLQDLQPGSFYYMGGKGGVMFGLQRANFLAEYEGMQGDNYVFTLYKYRDKDPQGPWINAIDQYVDFPIEHFQNRHIRLYTYNPGVNQENMNINGGINGGARSYYVRQANTRGNYIKRFKPKRRKGTRKANKKRSKKTRRNLPAKGF